METKKKKTLDPVTYVMQEREIQTSGYGISNQKITEYLNKKLGFEGHHTICHICEDPDIETWYVVRHQLIICSHCVNKTVEIEKKRIEYVETGLIENDSNNDPLDTIKN